MDYQTSVLVVTAVVICAAIIGFTLAAVHDSRKKSRLVLSGTPVPGEVIAVELRTGFDRERGRTNVMMKLRYTDPHTGQETTIRYATQPSREMPSRLNALGAGVAEVSGMAAGFRRVK